MRSVHITSAKREIPYSWGPAYGVLEALRFKVLSHAILSIVLKNSDTKQDLKKNIVGQTLEGGGGACCSPAWIRHRLLSTIKHARC